MNVKESETVSFITGIIFLVVSVFFLFPAVYFKEGFWYPVVFFSLSGMILVLIGLLRGNVGRIL
jgi:VIT1/CCC1 family predicted Fe2+/Mn2+ transporter